MPDLRGKLRTEGADDVVKASLLGRDSPRGKLCLDLSEPYFGICGPKRWQFRADCCEGSGGGGGGRRVSCHLRSRTSRSPMLSQTEN